MSTEKQAEDPETWVKIIEPGAPATFTWKDWWVTDCGERGYEAFIDNDEMSFSHTGLSEENAKALAESMQGLIDNAASPLPSRGVGITKNSK